jgi:hypothetical protein
MTPVLADFRIDLEKALAYSGGLSTWDELAAGVASGAMQFWPGVESAVITQLLGTPPKELYFFLAGGDLGEIEAMYPIIESWGREQGCIRASFMGRPGWERTFLTRAAGWIPTMRVFEKSL